MVDKSTPLAQHQQSIRRNILADRIVRAVQWIGVAAVVVLLVAPLAWRAYAEAGALASLIVLALGLALAWHAAPHGPSYAARCRAIDDEG